MSYKNAHFDSWPDSTGSIRQDFSHINQSKQSGLRFIGLSSIDSHSTESSSISYVRRPPPIKLRPRSPTPLELFERGKELLENGDLIRAGLNFDLVSGKVPDWIEPKILLVQIYSELEDWHKCADVGRKFIKMHPGIVSGYCTHAWALRKLHKYSDAIEVCNDAIQMFPKNVKLYSIRGQCYYDNGQFKEATSDFHESILRDRHEHGEPTDMDKGCKPWKKSHRRLIK